MIIDKKMNDKLDSSLHDKIEGYLASEKEVGMTPVFGVWLVKQNERKDQVGIVSRFINKMIKKGMNFPTENPFLDIYSYMDQATDSGAFIEHKHNVLVALMVAYDEWINSDEVTEPKIRLHRLF